MSAHDRHLAGFRYSRDEIECRRCEAWVVVEIFHEYGQTWLEPEECPACGAVFGEEPERDPDDH